MAKYATRSIGLLAAVALVALGACSDDGDGTDAGEAELVYEREGGVAGLEERWTLQEGGELTGPSGDVTSIDPADAEALFARIADLGFYDLDEEYLPDDPCCDRFTYRLSVEDGDRRHEVVTMDGVEGVPGELTEILAAVEGTVGG